MDKEKATLVLLGIWAVFGAILTSTHVICALLKQLIALQ